MTDIYSGYGWGKTLVGSCGDGSIYSGYGWGKTTIGSFDMRGNSFLTLVRRKNYFRDEAQYYKKNHIVALTAFLQQLKEWCTAFHLTVSFEMAEMDDGFVMNTDLAPQINPLYGVSPVYCICDHNMDGLVDMLELKIFLRTP